MPDWFGWVLSIFLGIITVWQFVQYLVDRKVRDANKKHMLAVKFTLQSLRTMCTEAIDTQEVIKSEATRQWVRQMGYGLLGIEHHMDALLESQGSIPESKDTKKLRTLLNEWVISGNAVIQKIKDDPGIPGEPGFARNPSQGSKDTAKKWIQDAREMLKNKLPDYLGRFDSVDECVTMSWVADGQRSNEFNSVIAPVAARVKRLGEFHQQV